MAVPKKRKSKAKAAQVKAGKRAVQFMSFSKCSNCGSIHLPHRVCEKCGYYNGRVYNLKATQQPVQEVETESTEAE